MEEFHLTKNFVNVSTVFLFGLLLFFVCKFNGASDNFSRKLVYASEVESSSEAINLDSRISDSLKSEVNELATNVDSTDADNSNDSQTQQVVNVDENTSVEAGHEGLLKINGLYYYYKNDNKLTNILKKVKTDSGTYYYYFTDDGSALTNSFKTIDDETYYFGKKGKAVTERKKIGHYMCYFTEKGVLRRKIDLKKKMIALTYDDGPSENTETILDVLEENDSVATFFVVGSRVSSYKDTLKRTKELGCEIGNHTYDHKILTRCSSSTVKDQIKKTNKAVKKILGIKPVVFRPPGGAYNDSVKSNIDMPLIIWSIDTKDWKTRNSSKTISSVMSNPKDGDIVLMHDLYEPTAKASKTIVPRLIEDGFQLVTVSELADCKGELEAHKAYRSFKK